jgi:hypothetical protein
MYAHSAGISVSSCVGLTPYRAPCSTIRALAVRAGQLICRTPSRLACSSRYLFVSHSEGEQVTAYDMTSDDLPCVLSYAAGTVPAGIAVALQDSVLIVVLCHQQTVQPVDIRAPNPADWRGGETFGGAKPGDATAFHPMDVAHVDGRLFCTDGSDSVRIFDVAMHPTAVAAPVTKDGAPLVVAHPIAQVTGNAAKFSSAYGIAAAPSLSVPGGVRVFRGSNARAEVAELSRDGVRIRTFKIDGVDTATPIAMDVAGDSDRHRLLILPPRNVVALSLVDGQQRMWRAPWSPSPVWHALIVDDLLLVALRHDDWVHIVPLSTFVEIETDDDDDDTE